MSRSRDRPSQIMHTRLLALGSNGSGQLGTGSPDDCSSLTPALLPEHLKPLQIAGGGNHTLLLCSDQSIWMAGHLPGYREESAAKKIEDAAGFTPVLESHDTEVEDFGFKLCAATWEAAIFIDLCDKVKVLGGGHWGELGLGKGRENVSELTEISSFPGQERSIVDIDAGMRHVVAVLDNGEVWGWGDGKKGQLGADKRVHWTPVQVWTGVVEQKGFKAVKVACGKDFTVVAGEADQGRFKILGKDSHGVISEAPQRIQGWTAVQTAWSSVYILLQSGQLLSWGRNDHGQLAPPQLPLLSMIVAGSEHIMALDVHRNVLTWGWGEHGNCGEHIDESGDVKNRFNTLKTLQTVKESLPTLRAIGAGCATSWIILAP